MRCELSPPSRQRVAQDRLGRRVQCHETLLDLGMADAVQVEDATTWLLAVVDGLFVARCDTVEPIDLDQAHHIVAATLDHIVQRVGLLG